MAVGKDSEKFRILQRKPGPAGTNAVDTRTEEALSKGMAAEGYRPDGSDLNAATKVLENTRVAGAAVETIVKEKFTPPDRQKPAASLS